MKAKINDESANMGVLKYAHHWHAQWKETLRAAVLTGESIDTTIIQRDDCCELGKWLYGDGQKLYWGKQEFHDLLICHREFHLLVGAVAEVINGQQYELATTYLGNDSPFSKSSREVTMAIERLELAVAV
jgi:methyl-accepting chemotaxis protein